MCSVSGEYSRGRTRRVSVKGNTKTGIGVGDNSCTGVKNFFFGSWFSLVHGRMRGVTSSSSQACGHKYECGLFYLGCSAPAEEVPAA